jgi:hypothetical protein
MEIRNEGRRREYGAPLVPAGRARARGLGLGEVAESSVPAALSAGNTAVMSKFQKTTAILCEVLNTSIF